MPQARVTLVYRVGTSLAIVFLSLSLAASLLMQRSPELTTTVLALYVLAAACWLAGHLGRRLSDRNKEHARQARSAGS